MNVYNILNTIVVLICLCSVTPILSATIHEEISPEEWAKLFPIADADYVPEYEIIPIHTSRIQKRDVDGKINIQLRAFGKDIELLLNPIDGILASTSTPVFTFDGLDIDTIPHIMVDALTHMYEDISQEATLNINQVPDGSYELDGIIRANDMYIRNIPNNYMNRYKRSVDNIPESEYNNYTHHIAFKLPQERKDLKDLENSLKTLSKSKRSNPDTLYTEVLIIVDFEYYELFEYNMHRIIQYLLAYWNGVDMKYRALHSPNLRINIAGIVITLLPSVLPYMEYYTPHPPHYLLLEDALYNFGLWLPKLESSLPGFSSDVAVTMTPKTFCVIVNDECSTRIDGIASISGMCSPIEKVYNDQQYTFSTNKTAIFRDTGSFNTIIIAAHELGHSFGMFHDGQDNNCNESDNFLMARNSGRSFKSSDLSPCSVEYLNNFLNTSPASCLYNKPKSGLIFPTSLPGRLLNAHEQCERLGGLKADFINATICEWLPCIVETEDGPFQVQKYNAADGTSCSMNEKKICLNGRCINDPDEIKKWKFGRMSLNE